MTTTLLVSFRTYLYSIEVKLMENFGKSLDVPSDSGCWVKRCTWQRDSGGNFVFIQWVKCCIKFFKTNTSCVKALNLTHWVSLETFAMFQGNQFIGRKAVTKITINVGKVVSNIWVNYIINFLSYQCNIAGKM